MSLLVEVDCPEPRVLADRIYIPVDGTLWDTNIGEGYWICPVTRSAMLAPYPTLPDWDSVFTGKYARLSAGDLIFPTADKWKTFQSRGFGDWWHTNLAVSEVVRTAISFPANQPMFVSFYVPGLQSLSKKVVFECGWGVPGAADTVSLRFWADGSVVVYKGVNLVGKYDSSGDRVVEKMKKGTGPGLAASTVTVMLLPCRQRDLVVIASYGEGFAHTFSDLPPNVNGQTITPASYFWFKSPPEQIRVQVAPVRFYHTATLYGPVVTLPYAPVATQSYSNLASDGFIGSGQGLVTYSLVKPDLSPFVMDGAARTCRAKVLLTDNTSGMVGTGSTVVYAVDYLITRRTTATANAPKNITPFVQSLSLSVPEDGAATLGMVLKAKSTTGTFLDDFVPKVERIGDRPVRVAVGGIDVFRGTLSKPVVEVLGGMALDLSPLQFRGVDRDELLQTHTIADAFPYDNLLLTDAVRDVVLRGGFSEQDLMVSIDSFRLPSDLGGVASGDFSLVPKIGDKAYQWLQKLHEDFAATWIKGWRPTASGYKWDFRSPSDFETVAAVHLYHSRADALAGGVPQGELSRRTVRGITYRQEEAEANKILVVGYDKRTGQYLWGEYGDAGSQTPGTLPASRPDNWRGKTVAISYQDAGLGTMAAVNRARDILQARLTTGRVIADFDCDLLLDSTGVPLWKGDLLRLYDVGGVGFSEWRIVAIPRIEFVFESDTKVAVRSCQYTCVKAG